MSDDAQVAALVDRTVVEFGRLDAAFGVNLRGVWSWVLTMLARNQAERILRALNTTRSSKFKTS